MLCWLSLFGACAVTRSEKEGHKSAADCVSHDFYEATLLGNEILGYTGSVTSLVTVQLTDGNNPDSEEVANLLHYEVKLEGIRTHVLNVDFDARQSVAVEGGSYKIVLHDKAYHTTF